MNWIMAMIAIIGVVLNIRRKWQCFLFWGVSNLYWLIYNFSIGEYEQVVIFGVFFIFCFYGSIIWESTNKAREKDVRQQNIIKSRGISLCRGIIQAEKKLNRESGRIKIIWLMDDARLFLELLGYDNEQADDNNNQ